MTYFTGYLAVGAVCLSIMFMLLRLDKQTRENKELWRRLDRQPLTKTDWLIKKILVPVIAIILILGLWPLFIIWVTKEKLNDKKFEKNKTVNKESNQERQFKVEQKHLLKPLSVADIEAIEVISDPLNAVPEVPFGFLNDNWNKFKSTIQPGDEIWSFSAIWLTEWDTKEMRKGYVIVQNNNTCNFFVNYLADMD